MKTTDNKNFIITLNYQWLADMINLDNIYKFDSEKFNDKKLLEVFYYYKDTKEALSLLGSVLNNIENALELTIYITEDHYPINAEIIYKANGWEVIEDDGYGRDFLDEEINNIRISFMKEAKDLIKYYKEYFLRIYDRSRTAK